MPSIREFDKKSAKAKSSKTSKAAGAFHKNSLNKNSKNKKKPEAAGFQKRRPGREDERLVRMTSVNDKKKSADDSVEYVEVPMQESKTENVKTQTESRNSDSERVEINFYGSETLRAKFPKPFELLEDVATEWVHDGTFENLPVGHPIAQLLLGRGLKKAKEVEKKIRASPQTEKVMMKVLQAGMKAQVVVNELKSRAETILKKQKDDGSKNN